MGARWGGLLLACCLAALVCADTCSTPDFVSALEGVTLSNPAAGGTYAPYGNCSWLIYTPGLWQRLYFNSFALACGDDILVSSGADPVPRFLFNCTSPPALGVAYPTSASRTYVEFRSRSNATANGFSLNYTTYLPQQCMFYEYAQINVVNTTRNFSNPMPFGSATTLIGGPCYYSLTAPIGYHIALNFTALDTMGALVKVMEGGQTPRSYYLPMSQYSAPYLQYVSQGNTLTVVFDATSVTVGGQGFAVTYKAVLATPVTLCNSASMTVYTALSGTITPFTPYNTPYVDFGGFIECDFIINAPENTLIVYSVDYALEAGDALYITNGMFYRMHHNTILTYFGSCANVPSTGSSLFVKAVIGCNPASRFRLTWTTIAAAPLRCDPSNPPLTDANGQMLLTSGDLSSCVWRVQVHPMWRVTVDVIDFTASDSADMLKIYNGLTQTGRVLGTLTGAYGVSESQSLTAASTTNFALVMVTIADPWQGSFLANYTSTPRYLPYGCTYVPGRLQNVSRGEALLIALPCPWNNLGFHSNYNNYFIQSTDLLPLGFSFSAFSMRYDYFSVYDGPNSNYPTPRVLATSDVGVMPLGEQVAQTNNRSTISIYSAYAIGTGFVVNVYPISRACPYKTTLTGTSGTFSNPPDWDLSNYAGNTTCRYAISAPAGQLISVTIIELGLALGDQLGFYDAEVAGTPIAVNPAVGKSVVSRINSLFITFIASNHDATDIGFRASFSVFTPTTVAPPCSLTINATLSDQRISDPSPYGGNYQAGYCYYTILAPPNTQISLAVNFVDLKSSTTAGADSLNIYDGVDNYGLLLASNTGTTAYPGSLSSSFGALTVYADKKYDNALLNARGYMITFRAVPIDVTQCSGVVNIQGTSGGTFSNPSPFGSGVGYQRNTYCRWQVLLPVNITVRVTIEQNMDYGDNVYLFAGPDNTYPIVVSGFEISGSYLVRGSFAVSFVTNNYDSGFSSAPSMGVRVTWKVDNTSLLCGNTELDATDKLQHGLRMPPDPVSRLLFYPPGLMCIWYVRVTAGTSAFTLNRIMLDDAAGDELIVLSGRYPSLPAPGDTGNILGRYPTSLKYNQPLSFTLPSYTSEAYVTVIFRSDPRSRGGYFNMRYGRPQDGTCATSSDNRNIGPDWALTGVGGGLLSYRCPTDFGQYNSQPYGDIPSSRWIVQANAGQTVSARFSYFDATGGNEVAVYDGARSTNPAARLIDTATINHMPGDRVYVSTANYLTFEMKGAPAMSYSTGVEISFATSSGSFIPASTTSSSGQATTTQAASSTTTTTATGSNNVGAQRGASSSGSSSSSSTSAIIGAVFTIVILGAVLLSVIMIRRRTGARREQERQESERAARTNQRPTSTEAASPTPARRPSNAQRGVEMGAVKPRAPPNPDHDESGPPVRTNVALPPPTLNPQRRPSRTPAPTAPPDSRSSSGSDSSSAEDKPPAYEDLPQVAPTLCRGRSCRTPSSARRVGSR